MFYSILYIILLAPLAVFAASKPDERFAGDGNAGMVALAAARPVGAPPAWVPGDAATGAFIDDTLAPTYDDYKARFEGLFSFSFLQGDAIAKAGAEKAAKALQRVALSKLQEKDFPGAEANLRESAQLGCAASMLLLGNMYKGTENPMGSMDYLGAYYCYILGAQTEYLLSGVYPRSYVSALEKLQKNDSTDPMARVASFYAERAMRRLDAIKGMFDSNPPVGFLARCLPFILGDVYAEETNAMPPALRNLRRSCTLQIVIELPGRTQEDRVDDVGPMPDFRGAPMTLSKEVERPDLRLYPHIELQDCQILGLTNIADMPQLKSQIADAYINGSYGLHMTLEERTALGLRLHVAADIPRNVPEKLPRWVQWLVGGIIDINERGEKVAPENAFKEGMRILWSAVMQSEKDKMGASKGLIMMLLKGLSEGKDVFNAEGQQMITSEIKTKITQLVGQLEKHRDRADTNMCLRILYREWAIGVLGGKINFDCGLNPVNVGDPSAKTRGFFNIMAKLFQPEIINAIIGLRARGLISSSDIQKHQDMDNELIYRVINLCDGRGFFRKDIPTNVKWYMHKTQQDSNPLITMDKAIDLYYQRMVPQDAPGLLKYAKAISKGDRIVGMDGKEVAVKDRGNAAHYIYSMLLGTAYQLNALNGMAMLIEENLVTKDEHGTSFGKEHKHIVLERIYRQMYHVANNELRSDVNREYYEHYKMLVIDYFITALENGGAERDLEEMLITPENREARIDHLLRQSTKSYHIADYAMRVYDGVALIDESGYIMPGFKRFSVAKSIIERITNAGYRHYMLGELYVREAIAFWEAFSVMGISERAFELAGEYLAMLKKAEECFAEAMAENVGDSKDRWSGISSEISRMKRIIKSHKTRISKSTIVVPTEPSVFGVTAVPLTASDEPAAGSVESSGFDDIDEEDAEGILSVIPVGEGSAALDAAGGPSLFAGTSFLMAPPSISSTRKASTEKPARHNRKVFEAAEERAQLPKTFDRWEMSPQAKKDFKKTPPALQDKIFELIDAIRSNQPLGRMEHLRADLDGWTSRRVTDGCRLVYKIEKSADGRTILHIKDCKGHYEGK